MYIHEQLMNTRHQERLQAAARKRKAAAFRRASAERSRRTLPMPARRLARLRHLLPWPATPARPAVTSPASAALAGVPETVATSPATSTRRRHQT